MRRLGLSSSLMIPALMLTMTGCASDSSSHTKGRLKAVTGITPRQVDEAVRPKKIALVWGINTFEDEFWPALRYAQKDAKDFAQVLRDPSLSGFDEVHLYTEDKDTTTEGIFSILEKFGERALREQDIVLLYVSSL